MQKDCEINGDSLSACMYTGDIKAGLCHSVQKYVSYEIDNLSSILPPHQENCS